MLVYFIKNSRLRIVCTNASNNGNALGCGFVGMDKFVVGNILSCF